jgi:hypothetical protein
LSYKLGIQGKGITAIRDLSYEEYKAYKNASDCLLDFSRDQQMYTIVLLNYDDFLNVIKKYSQEYAENPRTVNWILIERMVLDINRHLLNLLSSIRTFLDHTQTKLIKKYGAQSDRFKHFREACSKFYDASFSYRFLTKLRNYSQHCGMPLGSLTLHSEENPPYSGQVYHSLELKFSRDELLKYDSWGTRIALEISQLASEFGIVPHVIEMMNCIKGINLVLIEEELPELFKSAEFVEGLTSPALGKEGIPCILKFLEINRAENAKIKDMKIEITNIPFHIIQIVMNIKKQKASM